MKERVKNKSQDQELIQTTRENTKLKEDLVNFSKGLGNLKGQN